LLPDSSQFVRSIAAIGPGQRKRRHSGSTQPTMRGAKTSTTKATYKDFEIAVLRQASDEIVIVRNAPT